MHIREEALHMAPSNGHVTLHEELVLGRRALLARFRSSPARILAAGELLTEAGSSHAIYHLTTGWACQFREFSDADLAIVDVYLPANVVGLDAILRSRPPEKVMALSSVGIEMIDVKDAPIELMTCRSTALYIAWLLGQRQRRSDRLLAAISSLDARGRVATMLLDFYLRLRHQKLITGLTYNLPLTQIQIGGYLGLTVAHINRVLRSLRDDQIVNLEKHCVTILDIERLRRLAGNGSLASANGTNERSLEVPMPQRDWATQIKDDSVHTRFRLV
jgi:CRP/FNR family transcriptional regulator, anaerobic regulatory protein